MLESRIEDDTKTGELVMLIQQATRTADLLLDVAGRKQQATTNVLVVSPEWLETRARIVTALAPYPEASAAVAAALAAVPKAIGA